MIRDHNPRQDADGSLATSADADALPTWGADADPAMRETKRRRRLLTVVGVCVGLSLLSFLPGFGEIVVRNHTSSVDPGLYIAVPWAEHQVGELVTIEVPEVVGGYLRERLIEAGGDPAAAPDRFLKPIYAGAGDRVQVSGGEVRVNGVLVARQIEQAEGELLLPRWEGDVTLGEGQWWLMSLRCPGSLDSRYFGPVTTDDLGVVRVPLLRWEPWRLLGEVPNEPRLDPSSLPCPQHAE